LCSKGGDLIDCNASDDDEALAKIEQVLLDPGYVTAREAGLRVEYRPPNLVRVRLRLQRQT